MATHIIDDAQWRPASNLPLSSAPIQLSAGWNMLTPSPETDEYLPSASAQIEAMRPLLSHCREGTVSWTVAQGASTSVLFNGSSIETYGLAGPNQGSYAVILDGVDMGEYSALVDEMTFGYRLYAARSLGAGRHNLTLVNLEAGLALTFDYASVGTGASLVANMTETRAALSSTALLVPTAQASPPTLAQTQSNAAPSPPQGYRFQWNDAAIFVVAFAALIIAFIGVAGVLLLHRRCTRQSSQDTKPRRRRTFMEALQGRKISRPIEEGHSEK